MNAKIIKNSETAKNHQYVNIDKYDDYFKWNTEIEHGDVYYEFLIYGSIQKDPADPEVGLLQEDYYCDTPYLEVKSIWYNEDEITKQLTKQEISQIEQNLTENLIIEFQTF